MNVTYIKVFVDWLDAIEPLGDAERGRLFTSLLEYARTGAVPQLNGNERFIFPMMRAQVARDIAQMEATSENRGKRKKANENLSNLSGKSNLSDKRTQDKDKDKDKDEDKDKEGSPPTPSKETASELFKRLLSECSFSEELRGKLVEWMQYKAERREVYKETGLKSFASKPKANGKQTVKEKEGIADRGCFAEASEGRAEAVFAGQAKNWDDDRLQRDLCPHGSAAKSAVAV